MPDQTVSVLIAVHAGTPADQLSAALESVVGQTLPAHQIVVVVDGPVTGTHDAVLDAHESMITRIDLSTNVGLGRALQAGLVSCTETWVARADADDVNKPDRLKTQLAVLRRSGADVCSSSMEEVVGPSMHTVGVRRTATSHDEFARRMRMTNPVNHPAVMFRREAALRAGGYRHLPFLEDYDLWARMLRDGAQFVGVSEPLVTFRVDGMLQRRAHRDLIASERELRHNLRSYGIVGWSGSVRNMVVRGTYRRIPTRLRSRTYAAVFRDRDDG